MLQHYLLHNIYTEMQKKLKHNVKVIICVRI